MEREDYPVNVSSCREHYLLGPQRQFPGGPNREEAPSPPRSSRPSPRRGPASRPAPGCDSSSSVQQFTLIRGPDFSGYDCGGLCGGPHGRRRDPPCARAPRTSPPGSPPRRGRRPPTPRPPRPAPPAPPGRRARAARAADPCRRPGSPRSAGARPGHRRPAPFSQYYFPGRCAPVFTSDTLYKPASAAARRACSCSCIFAQKTCAAIRRHSRSLALSPQASSALKSAGLA
jgi:hypothetical protein